MANQKAALSQFRVCNASSVATPKKSTKTAKLVPSLILFMAMPSSRASAIVGHESLWSTSQSISSRCVGQRFDSKQQRMYHQELIELRRELPKSNAGLRHAFSPH
jgi:hypothetical protein